MITGSPVVFLVQFCLIQYALSQRLNTPTMNNINQFRTNARNTQLHGQITTPETGPGLEMSAKVPVTPNQQINLGTHVVPNSNDFLLTNLGVSKTVIPRTPLNEGQITTQTTGLVKDTLAKVPGVPKTPINPYKPLLANNNAFMNPSMANIGLGIGVSRQALSGAGMPSQMINGASMPSQMINGAGVPSMPYGGSGTGDVGVTGELPVNGVTSVKGQVPLTGKVSFTGNVPCGGIVTISGTCGASGNKVPYAQGPYGNKIYGY
ncbi:uncharacterized protein LOC111350092 [Spodoptera litura]|uniref:Uncharacterized protein LOC111350092 n=1 Tax=Spodoptera litura TaxID=69820 RepID=A0A9J7DWC3_SPOLT|nr:uncharacterized protein LOC111350092 [Spodoptera litura]